MGKTEDAINELEAAARISPNEPVLHFELGYLYYKQRDYDKATPELQLEIKNNPGYAQSYLYLGDIALHTNDDKAAEPLLQKALATAEREPVGLLRSWLHLCRPKERTRKQSPPWNMR